MPIISILQDILRKVANGVSMLQDVLEKAAPGVSTLHDVVSKVVSFVKQQTSVSPPQDMLGKVALPISEQTGVSALQDVQGKVTPSVKQQTELSKDTGRYQVQLAYQEADRAQEKSPSPATVLEFLKESNILSLDMSLKPLIEQFETLQPDPFTGWGIVAASGHLVLAW